MTESKDFVKPNHGSTPQPDHIMLSICGDAKTSMAVTWRTSIDVPSGYVEVYPENGGEKVRVEAITKEFKSDIDISNMHWAIIKNLKP
ncbi:MAG TPA: fibronectin type III domain-containing protein, partial [Clostridiales bacterium]|nr:fibronectin type III domain-containing protein [Clostridiales bacterium]